jgi:hypothetical protein
MNNVGLSKQQTEALQYLSKGGVETLDLELALMGTHINSSTESIVNRTLAAVLLELYGYRSGPEADAGSIVARMEAMADLCVHNSLHLKQFEI